MRSTACRARSRKSSTPRWRTFRSISSRAKARWPQATICRCRILRSSGATTRAGPAFRAAARPLSASWERLELYAPRDLARIITRSAGILGVEISAEGALEIASRSRGTPRIANRMLKRVRDFAQVASDGKITYEAAKKALDRMEVDELGLDANDRRMLLTMNPLLSRRPPSAWRRWPRPSGRRPSRSRTSTSRT